MGVRFSDTGGGSLVVKTHGGDIYKENGQAQQVLDFSANINPLGLPKRVKDAIVQNMALYSHYPDPNCRELKAAISAHLGVPTSFIVCGNGAADIIFRLTLSQQPKKALLLAPTFSEYESALGLSGCAIVRHGLKEANGFKLNEAILNDITNGLDMVFICNPNNPTGVLVERALMVDIAEKCKQCGVMLVVDECFNDFLEQAEAYSMVPLLDGFENVVVLKAFTKMYAMAGIRLGYALSSNEACVEQMSHTLQPWSVSTVASKCGVAALSEKAYVEKTKAMTTQNRRFITASLRDMGLVVFDACANYVLFKSADTALQKKLEARKILIRSCANYDGLDEHFYRIAVKNDADNQTLLRCMAEILEG